MESYYVGYSSYFRPLVYLLSFLGIPLILHRDATSTCKYRLLRLWGWILFAVNVTFAIGIVYISILSLNATAAAKKFSVTSTLTWITTMMQFNVVSFKMGSHLSCLLLAGSSQQVEMAKVIRSLWFPGLKIRPLSIATWIILLLVIPCKN